ncbi:MAG: exodeoxyribonuclease VII large subunit [Deltaproteobacteria bacterium]|nr:exodeoxyribonuclease VII large subunit [Deltaproteobacteria bacterium]
MSIKKSIYTVSALTSELKTLLDENYPIVWITGEVTNFASPGSGHFYFTLKDSKAQISAVMFKGQNRKLSFQPENGMEITGLCRISVYEPRGTYQAIFEHIEPKGTGALQIAFEQLKKRLADEGLFDDNYKISIPFLPSKISIITSPSGAVIHDIMNIIYRRYSNSYIEIIPARVQGQESVEEISKALDLVNSRMASDVIILARGGGSLEDLHAFNSETVARAIFASKIPVVSAVGHETDFTISDFVADMRAPTPSAAAELIVPEKIILKKQCAGLEKSLSNAFAWYSDILRSKLKAMTQRLKDPEKPIQDCRLKIDDLVSRMARACLGDFLKNKEKSELLIRHLYANNTMAMIKNYNALLGRLSDNLFKLNELNMVKHKFKIREISGRLHAMNPEAILERGYSITRILSEKTIIKDPEVINEGQIIETLLAKGKITSKVEGKAAYVKKDL